MDLTWPYQLIPSGISIFLIVTSTVATNAMKSRIDGYRDQDLEGKAKGFAKRAAEDWGIRFGFHSAMLAAIAAAIAVATDPFRVWLLVVTVLLLAAIWYSLQWVLSGKSIGELTEGSGLSLARQLDLLLIGINLVIGAMLVLNDPARRAGLYSLISALWPD